MMALVKILGLDAWVVKSLAVVLLGAIILGGGWWIHSRIYSSGYTAAEAHYTALMAQERAALAEADANELLRQTIANNAAKKREAEAIAALEASESQNLELRRRLASEAMQDPDAGKPVLGAGSVQRINKVR